MADEDIDEEDFEKCMHARRSVVPNADTVILPTILSFFTGADEVPPLGFPHPPTMTFSSENPYPTASTYAIQLTLPTKYKSYEEFRTAVAYALHTCPTLPTSVLCMSHYIN